MLMCARLRSTIDLLIFTSIVAMLSSFLASRLNSNGVPNFSQGRQNPIMTGPSIAQPFHDAVLLSLALS